MRLLGHDGQGSVGGTGSLLVRVRGPCGRLAAVQARAGHLIADADYLRVVVVGSCAGGVRIEGVEAFELRPFAGERRGFDVGLSDCEGLGEGPWLEGERALDSAVGCCGRALVKCGGQRRQGVGVSGGDQHVVGRGSRVFDGDDASLTQGTVILGVRGHGPAGFVDAPGGQVGAVVEEREPIGVDGDGGGADTQPCDDVSCAGGDPELGGACNDEGVVATGGGHVGAAGAVQTIAGQQGRVTDPRKGVFGDCAAGPVGAHPAGGGGDVLGGIRDPEGLPLAVFGEIRVRDFHRGG